MKRSDISTLTVLMGCKAAHTTYECMSYEAINNICPAADKVIYAAMGREVDKGLIDYGVSLRTAFLTADGETMLNKLLSK